MANERPFGFDPDDLDRVIREASEELRGFKDKIVHFVEADAQIPWTGLFADIAARTKRPEPRPETTGDTGDGVWAIYSIDDGGVARVEEVYATELDALRAHKHNTDPRRSVRFLPYGVTVSVLDQPKEDQPKEPPAPEAE
ncbi:MULTISPECIES: hypothetical protein [Rhodococcus]|jgi:hypothetical protein|uniref:Transmembrane protein n=1 Tax=Rhodococcus oxybenzonivorans TaxID=1990687 RepID=A0AAE4UXN9_9NOCA|nr:MULTISPECIES: hypothetical protein [Rhodococcus]MDV7242173.1 hypothetical protein [Rhodococcus oxybenzonivorans]MDV7264640.1 hypothetical protein [Rhodococcus oxybenzonivorans]MDV7276332.1 hypothetical protein [Rhodococcus oxybenzonivorans]MDV7331661.1 hypothetical protein [Rhodococcus oxybenzonivorans]MDV7343883.1 hypothetical protein [Rhodococcus oxybenzonivorans]